MTLSAGARLGPYEILAPLGAGGMGEVYRARDPRLGRDVAIKVLPSAFSSDPERLRRFEQEARVLASLKHPNIATIHGVEESDGIKALVMELVEGETLDQRIGTAGMASGPSRQATGLPISEALEIARQIAEALEAAHEKGIVHRDLKPANVKITPEGAVKVLDFGLAKADSRDGAPLGRSSAPTLMTTEPGMVLGTAPYMSPEQATGKEADRGSDVWAFACVLYEMLTGRPAFDGETAGEILAAVLKADPDWRRIPADTPECIRRLLHRSLHKDRRLRIRDIRDARLEIEDVRNGAAQQHEGAPQTRLPRWERVAWASTVAFVTVIAGVLGALSLREPVGAPESRLEITTPPSRDASLAISPDGRRIVFAAMAAGQSQLWLRSMEASSARPLRGAERGTSPFWSPDGRHVGFFADARLKLMDVASGTIKTLAPVAPAPLGGSWNADGTILFSASPGSPIFRTSAEGGDPVAVTVFEAPQQRSHSSPSFLPDGRHFLFFVLGSPEARGVYVSEIAGTGTRRLFDSDTPAAYANTGHLLFIREGRLLAQRFDADRLETAGEPISIAEPLPAGTVVSVSRAGPITYRAPAADTGRRQLVWVDRTGAEIERVVYSDTASLGPSLSRDGGRVAVFRFANGNMDIWSYERARRTWDRISVDSGDDIFPLWSADGSRIIFGSRRSSPSARTLTSSSMDLYSKVLDAPPGQGEELLLSTSEPKFPMDWSVDGRFVLYNRITATGGVDIAVLPLEGGRAPRDVVSTEFNEQHAQFSPDGKWVAYQSDRTGRFEVYVRAFPGPGADTLVSAEGGAQVRWKPDGRELFYIAPDDWLMMVPIRFSSTGGTVEPGSPVRLFLTNVGTAAPNTNRHQYSVSPDGESFLLNSVVGEASASPVTVILNWRPASR